MTPIDGVGEGEIRQSLPLGDTKPAVGSNPTAAIMASYYTIDTELRIIHLFLDCSGLKMAKKYKYTETFILHDYSDAIRLDAKMNANKLTICHSCFNKEKGLAIKDKRQARPGFRNSPAGWKPPVPRVVKQGARKNVTRD